LWPKLCGTSNSLTSSEKAAVPRHAGSFENGFLTIFLEVMGTGESVMFCIGEPILGAAKRTGRNSLSDEKRKPRSQNIDVRFPHMDNNNRKRGESILDFRQVFHFLP
jgi:hypothetical protein